MCPIGVGDISGAAHRSDRGNALLYVRSVCEFVVWTGSFGLALLCRVAAQRLRRCVRADR